MPKGIYQRRPGLSRHCRYRSVADRFWPKVQKTESCWLWTGARLPTGYGVMGGERCQGIPLKAHRVSWQLHFGPIPEGLHVCHHCDNPPCVNPDHLFVGTRSDNVRDMFAKGRHKQTSVRLDRRGALHPLAKLSSSDVTTIRARYAVGAVTQRKLASDYGISQSTVSAIVRKRRWSWLDNNMEHLT